MEMLIVVAVIGLTMLFVFPRAGVIWEQTQVRGARIAVVNRLNSARLAARQSSRWTSVRWSGNRIWTERRPRLVTLAGSTSDTVGAVTDLRNEYGVALTSGETEVPFDPRGLVVTGASLRLSRGGSSDSVLVSGFGRISR